MAERRQRFALGARPSVDAYHVWGVSEWVQREPGRPREIGLRVLGRSGLFLFEVKSRPGPEGDRSSYMVNPYRLANHKAKGLGSMLRRGWRPALGAAPRLPQCGEFRAQAAARAGALSAGARGPPSARRRGGA